MFSSHSLNACMPAGFFIHMDVDILAVSVLAL